ncbi:hypothetical protein ORIO_20815 (plasmid) [Cereibacter azotoformans]|uniref:hypothetical protein n=1 Tax=Cereibacter azotoformans TaxID=43057 RepID=UPI000E35C52D|nr:hypothetical protein [Cereibacter azotoformans]AXQ96135.1 hypothetical protein D0Z66_20705 [Cereibacter sphaeroides]UIJ32974.1 hypothetical protein LV780_20640 [Cereibacter azotoformans]ULB12241.1 hypothetical protein ORIO_20815 [Cereibacter azotoformans]
MLNPDMLQGFARLAQRLGTAVPVAPAGEAGRRPRPVADPPPRPEPQGRHQAFPLFAPPAPDCAPRPHALLAARLPPPAGTSSAAIGAWLAGEIHDPLAPVLALSAQSEALAEDLLQIEIQLFGQGEAGLAEAGARASCDLSTGREDAAWLQSLFGPEPAGGAPSACEAAAQDFVRALAEVYETFEPEAAAALALHGATLKIAPDLARLLAGVKALEADWLEEGPAGGMAAQDLRGAPSPAADLRRPTVLRRAAFLHLLTSRSVPGGLRDALVETRFAQALALAPESLLTPGAIEARLSEAPARERLEDLLAGLAWACLTPTGGVGTSGAPPPDPVDLFERFRERAAIREHEGGQPRPLAERESLCELATGLALRPGDLLRAWHLVPGLAAGLRALSFRTRPRTLHPARSP